MSGKKGIEGACSSNSIFVLDMQENDVAYVPHRAVKWQKENVGVLTEDFKEQNLPASKVKRALFVYPVKRTSSGYFFDWKRYVKDKERGNILEEERKTGNLPGDCYTISGLGEHSLYKEGQEEPVISVTGIRGKIYTVDEILRTRKKWKI